RQGEQPSSALAQDGQLQADGRDDKGGNPKRGGRLTPGAQGNRQEGRDREQSRIGVVVAQRIDQSAFQEESGRVRDRRDPHRRHHGERTQSRNQQRQRCLDG